MKQYKLIKEYPGSPKLGQKIDINNIMNSGEFNVEKNHLLNYPHFWQEITKPECKCGVFDECDKSLGCKRNLHKPEYTILSFKHKNGSIWGHYKNGDKDWYRICVNGACGNLEYYLKEKNYSIHSVRRESDGEVFTVGDITYIGKIKSFELGAEQNLGIIIVHGEFSQQLSHITKVKLKEWEITAFKCSKNNILYTLKTHDERDHHFILNGLRHREREILEHFKSLEIYSVKRLSDGEEFKIGDKCEQGIIKSFEILNNIFQVNFIEKNNCPIYFKYLRKAKQPLFTTEDGVEIFEGDNFTSIHKQQLRISGSYMNTKDISPQCRIWDGSDGYLQFSTKKAALNYIKCNKPCLSLNDILPFLNSWANDVDYNKLKQELTKLVKSKLKE